MWLLNYLPFDLSNDYIGAANSSIFDIEFIASPAFIRWNFAVFTALFSKVRLACS